MVKKTNGEKSGGKVAPGDAFAPSPVQPVVPSHITFTNHQRVKPVNLRPLCQITEAALAQLPDVRTWNLMFHLVGAKKMASLNETHLGHEGPTDVITFDYAEQATRNTQHALHGEIFICIPVAVRQAREFRTTWQSEVVRYAIHALLHLCGYDDQSPADRRRMKQVENRLVRRVSRQFKLSTLGR